MKSDSYNIKSIRDEFKKKGIFYTPKEQAEMLKKYITVENIKTVYDPACGHGALLAVFGDDIEKYGQDIEAVPIESAREELINFKGEIGDTITDDKFKHMTFDAVIANPPFSIAYDDTSENLKNDERFKDLPCLAPKSRADFMFIFHCLSKTKNQAVIMNFPGIGYRKAREYKLRKYLIELGVLDKVIHVAGNTFVDTAVPTLVLVLDKHRTKKTISFIDTEKNLQREVSLDEIIENDYNLSVSTYVFEEVEKEKIDPLEVQKQAHEALKKHISRSMEITQLACILEHLDYNYYLDDLKCFVNNLEPDAEIAKLF